MDSTKVQQIKAEIEKLIGEARQKALKDGVSINTPLFNKKITLLKTKLFKRFGISKYEYDSAGTEFNPELVAREMADVFEEEAAKKLFTAKTEELTINYQKLNKEAIANNIAIKKIGTKFDAAEISWAKEIKLLETAQGNTKKQLDNNIIFASKLDEDIKSQLVVFADISKKVLELENRKPILFHNELQGIGPDDHHTEKHTLESHIDSDLMRKLRYITSGEFEKNLYQHIDRTPRIIDIAGITQNDADLRYLQITSTVPLIMPDISGNNGKVLGITAGALAWTSGGGVSSVASANGSVTVTDTGGAIDLAVVKAPILSTARTINGVSFDGSANITVTAAAGTLTGLVLNATVVTSSLTTIGTITSGGLGTGAVIGGVTMTLGSDAANDIYYRNSSGVLTRLANGTTGQFLKATTGSAPSWATPGGTPGGSDTQLQFNNAGAFGGAAGTVYQSGSSPNLTIQAQNAAHVAFLVKGAASQSANLQEWRNSSGTILALVDNVGRMAISGATSTSVSLQVGAVGVATTLAVNKWLLSDDNINVTFANLNAGAFLFYNRVGSAGTSLGMRFHVTTSDSAAIDIDNNKLVTLYGALLITGNVTKINNVATSWPSSQGAANTFLKNDGSGNLSWAAAGSVTPLFDDFADAGNTADTNEDTLYTHTIAAGQWATNGDKIFFDFGGTFAANGASKEVKVYVAGTVVGDSSALTANGGSWRIFGYAIRVSSTTLRVICTVEDNITSGVVLGQSSTYYTSIGSLTLANTQIIKCTGQSGGLGGGSANDIVAKQASIYYMTAA